MNLRKNLILIVDDDEAIRYAFSKTFDPKHYSIIGAQNGLEAIKLVEEKRPALVFMDVTMPEMDGLEALEKIREKSPQLPIVIITGYGSMDTAIKAMQIGAYDYLTKPLDIDKVRIIAKRALEMIKMKKQIDELQRQLNKQEKTPGTNIIGQHPSMQNIFKKIGVILSTPNTTNVLIIGDTGTGKELVARVIHEKGNNPNEPFQAINCTVLPENLLESELFGHEKGAFTGADKTKPGKFELAGKGTLFLDEIGDMPEPLQIKLLRVIQERTFERLGGNESFKLEARIVSATNHNLVEAVQNNQFRKDLYYRLNVIEILIPPLRKRKDDIILLINHFIEKYNQRIKKNVTGVESSVLNILFEYDFPGNVRELENMIERAIALERSDILTPQSLPPQIFTTQNKYSIDIPILNDNFNSSKQAVVEAFERKFIKQQLLKTRGNVAEAARISGIERQSFQRIMKKYNLSSQVFRKQKV